MRKVALAALIVVAATFAVAGGGQAMELVMVEEKGCSWCARWDAEIAPVYPLTDEGKAAPLRRVELHGSPIEELSLKRPVSFTPTFVLTDDGKELGRIEGYPGEDFFWPLLRNLMEQHMDFGGG